MYDSIYVLLGHVVITQYHCVSLVNILCFIASSHKMSYYAVFYCAFSVFHSARLRGYRNSGFIWVYKRQK